MFLSIVDINPCRNCSERKCGCHSNCIKYTEWKEQHEYKRKIIRQKRDIYYWKQPSIIKARKFYSRNFGTGINKCR